MANVVLPTFPGLASDALFIKGFAYTASGPAAYVSFGHSFLIGQLPDGSGLQASFGGAAVPCQVDIKTKYADGSAAWAVVTVQAPGAAAAGTVWGQFSPAAGGGTALGLGTALGATALVLTIAATTPAQTFTEDLVALVKAAAFDPWLSGPLAVQGRASVTLYQGLRVAVDLTAYADGTVNADVMVANDIAMLPAAGTVDYTSTLTLNGAAAYTSPALTHYQYTNWTAQVGTRAALPQVIHNPADFIEAQAVQPWDLTLGVDPTVISGAQSIIGAAGFGQPFTNPGGLMDQSMGDTGGRTDIGPNDAWQVAWLTTQDPSLYAVSIEAANVGGGIPWHFWNAGSGDNWKITDTAGSPPTVGLWFGQQTDSWTVPLTQAVPSGPGWNTDDSHFPEIEFLPALLTGRRYYVDELNAATYFSLICKWPFYRSNRLDQSQWNEYCGTEGYVFPGEQIRAGAWAMRNLFYSYYATPDGDPRKTYVKQIIDSNFTWLNGQTAAWSTFEGQCSGYVPVGICCTYGSPPSEAMPPWQQDYSFSSVAMGAMMGYQPAQQFAEWMANFIVGRFASNVSGWYPQDGIAYNWQVFPGGYNTGDTPPQTWAAMEAAMQAADASQCNSSGVATWTHQAMGDYAALAWNSLYEAQTLGLAGAATAIEEMIGWNIPQANTESYWTTLPGPAKMVARTLNDSQVFATAAPPVSITAISLSGTSLAAGAAVGTTVGTISVTMSDGSTFAGTLSLGGANEADFSINGASLITSEALATGSYVISITATPTNTAIAPLTASFTITEAAAPAIASIVLSANTFAYGAPNGTVVGAISVAMSSGSFSGTLALAGTNAADFAISGANLVTVGALAPGAYAISMVATQSGASNSPFTQAFTITGEAAPNVEAVILSSDTFAYGSPSGTVIGTISVEMSDGSAFVGALSLTGANAADFTISASSALETVGALASGSYDANITATPSNTSSLSLTQAFTITGEAPTVAQLVAKAQADLAATVSTASSSLTALAKAVAALETTEEKKLNAAIVALVTQANNLDKQSATMLATVTADLDAVAAAVPTL